MLDNLLIIEDWGMETRYVPHKMWLVSAIWIFNVFMLFLKRKSSYSDENSNIKIISTENVQFYGNTGEKSGIFIDFLKIGYFVVLEAIGVGGYLVK